MANTIAGWTVLKNEAAYKRWSKTNYDPNPTPPKSYPCLTQCQNDAHEDGMHVFLYPCDVNEMATALAIATHSWHS